MIELPSYIADPEAFSIFLDSRVSRFPARLFKTTPEKDSTPVRSFIFALENIIDHLKKPLAVEAEKLIKALVYKHNGPQRHQLFWRYFKCLFRALRKYNDRQLLQFCNNIHRKSSASGDSYYMPTDEVMNYIGSSFIGLLYRLDAVRQFCVCTADSVMGMVELGHWENLSIFLMAVCGEVNYSIVEQANQMKTAYGQIGELLHRMDERYPPSLDSIPLLASLNTRPTITKTVDTDKILRLLKFTEEEMESALEVKEMERIKMDVLAFLQPDKKEELDFGVAIQRTFAEEENFPQIGCTREKVFSFSAMDSVIEEEEVEMIADREEPVNRKRKKGKKKAPLSSVDSAYASGPDVSSVLDTSATEVMTSTRKKRKAKKRKLQMEAEAEMPSCSSERVVIEDTERSVETPTKKKKRVTNITVGTNSSEVTSVKKKKKKRSLSVTSTVFDDSVFVTETELNEAEHDGLQSVKKKKKKKKSSLLSTSLPVIEKTPIRKRKSDQDLPLTTIKKKKKVNI